MLLSPEPGEFMSGAQLALTDLPESAKGENIHMPTSLGELGGHCQPLSDIQFEKAGGGAAAGGEATPTQPTQGSSSPHPSLGRHVLGAPLLSCR